MAGRGKRNRDGEEADSTGADADPDADEATNFLPVKVQQEDLEEDDRVPEPSTADTTKQTQHSKKSPKTAGKEKKKKEPKAVVSDDNTIKEFNALIPKENPAVSWVGTYTTAHETKVEIGFLKKEAMALTTLLSYYQEDGDGATSCPVAMVSGQASLGRKLSIFYSSGVKRKGNCGYYYYNSAGMARNKVNLSVGFKMENQKMRTLAKLGRADFYLGTLDSKLKAKVQKGKKKVVLDVTEDGKLKMAEGKVRLLTGAGYQEMQEFEEEVFQSNQIDIVNLMLKHLEFEDFTLRQRFHLLVQNSHLLLAELVVKWYPGILGDPALGGGNQLLRLAIDTGLVEMVECVLNLGPDVNAVHPHDRSFMVYPLHRAVVGTNFSPYRTPRPTTQLGCKEIVSKLCTSEIHVE